MRNCAGDIQEKGPRGIVADEFYCLGVNDVSGVILSAIGQVACGVVRVGIVGKRLVSLEFWVSECNTHFVIPERIGIKVVRETLAVVTEESIDPLLQRAAFGCWAAKAPFAERAAEIASIVESPDKRFRAGRNRILAFLANRAVVANESVPRMQTRHQDAARRRADSIAAVVPRETHPFRCESVDVRRANFRRAVATEVSITEIVGENEDNVWRARHLGGHTRS